MFWKRKPSPEGIDIPEVPALPTFYGPTTYKITRIDRGEIIDVCVWVGGLGKHDNGKWGEVVHLSMVRAPENRAKFNDKAQRLILSYASPLTNKFGEDGAIAITHLLLWTTMTGRVEPGKYTADFFKEMLK